MLSLQDHLDKIYAKVDRGFHVGLHIQNMTPVIHVNRYSDGWKGSYSEGMVSLKDPVLAWGLMNTGYSDWCDVPGFEGSPIQSLMAEYDVAHGIIFSTGPAENLSMMGIATSGKRPTDDVIQLIQKHFQAMHEMTNYPSRPDDQTLLIMQVLAEENSEENVAGRLELSIDTVNSHLKEARKLLGCTTNEEAIEIAERINYFPYDELFKF